MVFLGRFPGNLKHGIKPIIDYDGEFRFIFGPSSLLVVFNSKYKRRELELNFDKVFREYIDVMFLFDISKKEFSKICLPVVNEHLFYKDVSNMSIDEKIDKIHLFIDMMISMRQEISDAKNQILLHMDTYPEYAEYSEVKANIDEAKNDLSEEELDNIIDKVSNLGYNSLTPDEKKIFDKIFKR